MIRDDVISMILTRVGQRQNDAVLQAQALVELKFVQEELERGEKPNLPWFLKTEYTDAAFKTSASTPSVAVHTGFLRELDEERAALFYQDATLDDQWVALKKVDYDEGKTEFGGTVPGRPQAYTLFGESYRFWPDPDAEYPLKALIFVTDAVLTTNVENKWLKHASKLIMGRTGEVVAGTLVRDEVAHAIFADMASRGAEALERMNTAREEAGRSREMGED